MVRFSPTAAVQASSLGLLEAFAALLHAHAVALCLNDMM
jgi:hypothetical protein